MEADISPVYEIEFFVDCRCPSMLVCGNRIPCPLFSAFSFKLFDRIDGVGIHARYLQMHKRGWIPKAKLGPVRL